jgi:hypothetical protein
LTRESRPNGGAPGRSDLGENRSSRRWGHDPNSPDACTRGHDPNSRILPTLARGGRAECVCTPRLKTWGTRRHFLLMGVPQVVPTWGQPAPQHRAILHPSPHAEFSRRHFLLMGVPQVVPTWVNPISPSHSTGSSCTHHRTPRARKAGDPARKSPAVIASMATRSVDSRSVDPRQKISGCRAGPTSKIDCVLSSVVESGNAWNACT